VEILSSGGRISDGHVDVVLRAGLKGVVRKLSIESSVSIGVEEESNRSDLKHAFEPHRGMFRASSIKSVRQEHHQSTLL